MQQLHKDELPRRRRRLIAADGEDLGYGNTVFYDPESGRVEFIGVGTGWFSRKYAPLRGARIERTRIILACTSDELLDAPDLAAAEQRTDARRHDDDYRSRDDGGGR